MGTRLHAAPPLLEARADDAPDRRARELAEALERLESEARERERLESDRAALRRQLASAEEAERGRLSRELHDQLGQHLAALGLGLEEVARMVLPYSPARARLASLQHLTALLTRDARYLALELRPPELDDLGLASAVESYVSQWSDRYGIVAEVEVTGEDVGAEPVAGGASTALYRVLQEALTNVARHADATHVSVILERPDAGMRLIVEDDGRGFDAESVARRATAERRLGLAGMRERMSTVGGSLVVESAPAGGTTIYARVPVSEEAR